MDSLPNAVASQDPVQVTGSWQRHLPVRFLDRGRPMDSVTIKAYRHLVDPVEDPDIRHHLAPRALVTVELDVTEILDLRTAKGRWELGLTMTQIRSATNDRAAYKACQAVAAAAHQQGFHGLVAPAATEMGETLALFSNLLPANELPTVVDDAFWEQLPDDPSARQRLRLVRDVESRDE